ncbi:MAG: hypothetical protein GEU97_11030 [Actinophytocola sp.]|nr:hypothetical protein [Actinophytocola sp.]
MNVTVTRDDGLWVAVAEGLPEGVVGAMDYEHFSDLHAEFPDFLADLLDRDPGPIEWRYEIKSWRPSGNAIGRTP